MHLHKEITRKMHEARVARAMTGHNKTNGGHSAVMSRGTSKNQKLKILYSMSLSKGTFVVS